MCVRERKERESNYLNCSYHNYLQTYQNHQSCQRNISNLHFNKLIYVMVDLQIRCVYLELIIYFPVLIFKYRHLNDPIDLPHSLHPSYSYPGLYGQTRWTFLFIYFLHSHYHPPPSKGNFLFGIYYFTKYYTIKELDATKATRALYDTIVVRNLVCTNSSWNRE